jgi:hypothetical protein
VRRADHSSRGVQQSVVCLSVIVEHHKVSHGLLGLWHKGKENVKSFLYKDSVVNVTPNDVYCR